MKKVIIDFDDFFETSGGLEELFKLKDHYPNFKVTMFTIPLRCSDDWWKKMDEIDWIQHAVHGTNHANKEFGDKEYDYCNKIMEIYKGGHFVKGFKAPHWSASEDTIRWLKDNDFWIAIEHPYRTGRKKILKDMKYYSYMEDKSTDTFGEFSKYHDHINWGNGLLKRVEQLKTKWDRNSEFVFINDVIKTWDGYE